MSDIKTASKAEWLEERLALLKAEKKLTQMRDEVNAQRQKLPWVLMENDYIFHSEQGEVSLADLFGPHSQLVIYHFMFPESWDEGCVACTFWADNFALITPHMAARDISFMACASATLPKINAYKKRMGWDFPWVSSHNSSFNRDLNLAFTDEEKANNNIYYNYKERSYIVEELQGVSGFVKDEDGNVYHTYSTYERGVEIFNGALAYLDVSPKGRNENGKGMFWLKRRDEY